MSESVGCNYSELNTAMSCKVWINFRFSIAGVLQLQFYFEMKRLALIRLAYANPKMEFEFLSQIYAISHPISLSANERITFSLKKNGKVPGYVFDGMTSDVNGILYITTFGGHKVMKIDPK